MGSLKMSEQINILVGDKLADAGLEYLNSLDGVSVDVKTGLSEDELCSIVGNYDGLVARSKPVVTAKILANPGKLKAIARAGVGVDNIDLDAATKNGVLVMNSAEASTITTAEHAFALMLALARNIGPAYKRMSEGGWDRNKFVGMELEDKTLGVVGFGRIGQTMARKAVGFGMKVLAFDPVYNAESALDGQVKIIKKLEDLVSQVDVLSFHVPLNDHTRNMLNADLFTHAKPGLLVVNAARGGVIDLEALKDAIESGQCGGAAIDVYEKEPLEEDSDLRGNPKILLTPHLGASTSEAQEGVSTHACSQIYEYLSGQGLRGAVNASGVRLDLDPTQAAYLDLEQRMAKLI
ncbi:MAG: hydroxyacid dehydrogenase [Planctomycetota bacterium]